MGLQEYKSKRRFDQTPEPRGKEAADKGPLRFVVQLHKATRLHYDFRLELDGVLKSWAVPKGPSLNPDDKRLSVMVEDHPFDYRNFEGAIPKGNYGAGTVMVWDQGFYTSRATNDRTESERILREGLEKGHITFLLLGEKLKGEFALVKLKKGEDNTWLLLKKGDGYASKEDVTKKDRSAITKRTMEEIAAGQGGHREWLSDLDLSGAPSTPMPRAVSPMLAQLSDKPFDREDWLFEIKWDGYRTIAEVEKGTVKLYSRRDQPFNAKYPSVAESLTKLAHDVVLDGEIVVLDDNGKSRFQLLQEYEEKKGQLVYYVFDILYLDGRDLRSLPLFRRKEILKQVLPVLPNVRFSDHVEQDGLAFFQAAVQQNLEGIIAKDGTSPYRMGNRSNEWLKIKTHHRQEAVIAGYTAPQGGRKHFGALVLGIHKEGEFRYIGHTGTGFDETMLAAIAAKLKPLVTKTPPFREIPKTNAPVTWVEPKLVCDVSFQEWTTGGHMRLPVFVGIREDKSAQDVVPEKEVSPPASGPVLLADPKEEILIIDGHRVKLTNLDKTFWLEEQYTKGDVITYYREIASTMLPYLKDRPENMHRHPNGITAESFYQKDVDAVPEWVETVKVHSDSEDKEIDYLVCQNEATLVYMANLGCIEIHPWNSRVGSLENPDYLIMDLDPLEISFEKVIESARVVREVLEQAGVAAYCKTSGATGLHIMVPLGARYPYEIVRRFAELIANMTHKKAPSFTSVVRSPEQRKGRVYLDYLQNRAGQTLASAYSVRPKPGATVSTPLKWDEVKKGLDPMDFTIKTIRQRVKEVGDLWKPVLGPGINLEQCLHALQRQ